MSYDREQAETLKSKWRQITSTAESTEHRRWFTTAQALANRPGDRELLDAGWATFARCPHCEEPTLLVGHLEPPAVGAASHWTCRACNKVCETMQLISLVPVPGESQCAPT
jgi:hypothetical protein